MIELIIWAVVSSIAFLALWYMDRNPYPKPSKKFQAHPIEHGEVGRFRK